MAHEVIPDPPSQPGDRQLSSSHFPQFLAAFFATLSAMAAGAAIAWSSPVLPLLQAAHVITNDQAAWVGSLITLGAFIGALPAGCMADSLGRKGLLVVTAVPMLASWLFVAFSPSVWGLYFGRILSGISVGLVSVACPMYISEISEASIRGTLGTFFQLQITVGILFVYLVGFLENALYISVICASLPLFFVCTFVWMPESPSYLLSIHRKEDATNALQWLRGFHYDVESELNILRGNSTQGSTPQASILDLFRDRVTVRALGICLGLMVFQQLSAINGIIFSAELIFEEVGNSFNPTVACVVIAVVQVFATYTSTVLVDRAGRRSLLLISDSVMSLCLALLGLYFFLKDQFYLLPSTFPVIFLAVYIFVFSLGFGPIPWVVMGELFPDHLKGVANALVASASWLLAFAASVLFVLFQILLGYGITFFIFSGLCILGTMFVAVLLPETKGKDINTIQAELRGEKSLIVDEYINQGEAPFVVVKW